MLVEICCLGLEMRLAKCVYLAYSLFEGMETDVEDIGIGLGELIVAEQRVLVIVDEDGTIAVPEGVLCGLGCLRIENWVVLLEDGASGFVLVLVEIEYHAIAGEFLEV